MSPSLYVFLKISSLLVSSLCTHICSPTSALYSDALSLRDSHFTRTLTNKPKHARLTTSFPVVPTLSGLPQVQPLFFPRLPFLFPSPRLHLPSASLIYSYCTCPPFFLLSLCPLRLTCTPFVSGCPHPPLPSLQPPLLFTRVDLLFCPPGPPLGLPPLVKFL